MEVTNIKQEATLLVQGDACFQAASECTTDQEISQPGQTEACYDKGSIIRPKSV